MPAGIRIFGPNATVAQDLEPEYVAVSPDSRTAWVTLQENNALAVIDIPSATVTGLLPLEILTFGARSFSIRDAAGHLVWDSGNEIELITAAALSDEFNSNNDENGSADARSDDKGPEPEGLALGRFRGRTYAFVGLERIGGVLAYDVTDPRAPFFVQYVNNRRFEGDAEAGTAGDLGPEGLIYIPREESPIPRALLVVANEVSGTVTIYSIKPRG